MGSFFRVERIQAGWRFFVLWMLATALGFGLGLALEFALYQRVVLWIAVPLGSMLQAWILNRHISIFLPWFIATSAAFWIGGGLAAVILQATLPDAATWLRLSVISLAGGALGGALQWLVARYWLPRLGIWWILIGALSWQIPGLICGLALLWPLAGTKISLEDRQFELSGQF